MGIIEKYKSACVKDGVMVFTPAGTLIKLKAGSIKPQWDHDKGFILAGLKPGFRLATPDCIETFKADQARAKAAKGKPAPAPALESKKKLKR